MDSQQPSHPSRLHWRDTNRLEQQRQSTLSLLDFYRRRVLFSKYILPILAFGLVTTIVLWPQLHPEANRFRLGAIHASKIDLAGEGLTIKNPRLVGTDDKDQPYTITANSAYKKAGQPDVIYMGAPKADITLKNNTWIIITSNEGQANEKSDNVQFSSNVKVFEDRGYEVTADILDVDMSTGNMRSDKPVNVKGPDGIINATGFDLSDKGKLLKFHGPATMVLYQDKL